MAEYLSRVRQRGRLPKLVALSFDDGPAPETELILDVLREHDAVATFFALGKHIAGREPTLRRIAAEGSEVGNHTFSHPRCDSISPAALRHELTQTNAAIVSAIGKAPNLMRPPNGIGCEAVAPIAAALGMTAVRWTLNPKDWVPRRRPAEVVERVLADVRGGSVVVLHDGSAQGRSREATVEAVSQLVPELIERGFRLVTLSELLTRSPSARWSAVPAPRNALTRHARATLRRARTLIAPSRRELLQT